MLYLHQGGYDTILAKIPHTYYGKHQITISVRDYWISVWIDSVHTVTVYSDVLKEAGRLQFGVYGEYPVYFDDIRIAELTEVIDYNTLDPGEPPAACLSRILGRRHIKFFMRFDNALRMWRPKDTDSVYTYDSNVVTLSRRHNQPVLASHTRVVGATDQADTYDKALSGKIGHSFRKLDDPDLMTFDEAEAEAGYYADMAVSQFDTVTIEVPAQVLQEIEDKVTITQGEVSGDYYVDHFSLSAKGSTLKAMLYGRRA